MIRATVIVGLLTLAPMAHAQDVTGDWSGRYICNQGVTAVHLIIQSAGKPGAITATFSFGPPPENPEVPKGTYVMRGKYESGERRLWLQGQRWIKQPFGYVMVGLDGRMSPDGDKIVGRIPDMDGCTNFEVRRTAPLIG
ncbi:MAG: hypothetical protein EON93_08340 [Burkholderiales bacterium]|nr:MAG: hypothetical protein EON93_08340 [Burkholderiales bacterium]